jgi:hypothetical protein
MAGVFSRFAIKIISHMWPTQCTYAFDYIILSCILLISNSIWFLAQSGKSCTREFFKDFKLHSSFGLVQFLSSLKNSLVHVFSKLHSKPLLLPIQTQHMFKYAHQQIMVGVRFPATPVSNKIIFQPRSQALVEERPWSGLMTSPPDG